MEWNYQLALQLIDEYRNHPVLWNSREGYYYNKNKKREAWEEIAKNVKVHVVEVKQKMNSLLGSFRREKSRGRKRIGTNKGTKEIYTSKWFAFSRMGFLLDRNEPREPEDTTGVQETQPEELPEVEGEFFCEVSPSPEDVNGLQENPFPSLHPVSPKRSRKRTRSVEEYSRTNEDFHIVKNVTSTSEDSCAAFGNYIGAKLREFDERTRAIVQQHINKILFEADMGKYDNLVYPQRDKDIVKQEFPSPFIMNSPDSASNSFAHPFQEPLSPVSKCSPVSFS